MTGARLVVAAAVLGIAFGCGSTPLTGTDPNACPSQERAEVVKCAPASLDPVTDPESPEFGRVPCRMFAAWSVDDGLCGCDAEGYRPLSRPDADTARQRYEALGVCPNACCEHLCFCELLQLSGDALVRCQAGVVANDDIAGFCYVEPELGVGDPSTTSNCPSDERRLVRLTPDYMNFNVTLVCEKGP